MDHETILPWLPPLWAHRARRPSAAGGLRLRAAREPEGAILFGQRQARGDSGKEDGVKLSWVSYLVEVEELARAIVEAWREWEHYPMAEKLEELEALLKKKPKEES